MKLFSSELLSPSNWARHGTVSFVAIMSAHRLKYGPLWCGMKLALCVRMSCMSCPYFDEWYIQKCLETIVSFYHVLYQYLITLKQ